MYTRISKAQVAHPQILAAFEAVERWIAGMMGAAQSIVSIEPIGP